MEIKILYSDKDIAVCVKPVGVSSESPGMPELLSEITGSAVFPVHRLDKAVGGLMVYALNKTSAAALSAEIVNGGFEKRYLAVISGELSTWSGVMKDLLFHDRAKNKSYVVKRKRAGVKEAELEYTVLESDTALSLLDIRLKTGRSHQIRVQFSARKHPLVGDVKYGSTYKSCPIALFSAGISFTHPVNSKRLSFDYMPETVFPWNEFKHGGTT